MSSIPILVMHSGSWNDSNCYVGYVIEGIVFKENTSYIELYNLIAIQIGVDVSVKTLKIEYKIDENSAPMIIHNDMGVRVYVMLKKSTNEFNRYPICITLLDTSNHNNEICETSNQLAFGRFGEICITGNEPFEQQQLAIAELVDPLDVFEAIKSTTVISDPFHKSLKVKQLYNEKATLKSVMEQYAIAHRFQFKTERSNSDSYTLVCFSDGCNWLMRASEVNKSGMFKIREFVEEHTCPLKDKVYAQRQMTSNLLGGIIKPKLADHKRKYTPKDIKNDVKMELGVDITYMKAWRAKEKALTSLRGTPAGSYSKLPKYLYILDITYPGSHIRLKKTEESQFLYLFVALHPFIKGFEYCRPVVVVDDSHMRGTYNGKFVAASTMDGAGHIFPLAYGVIDSENDASWT